MSDKERIHEESIFSIISRFYPAEYKLVRNDHKALSPFTAERTPSFHIREDRGYFKCFSTGIGGDAIKFVMEYERVTFAEAIDRIYDVMGWERDNTQHDTRPATRRWFADFAHKKLNEQVNLPVLRYLCVDRKLSIATIKSEKIGFILDSTPVPQDKADDLMAAGLVKMTKAGNLVWTFGNRMIMPYLNISGGVSGFTARQVPGYDTFLQGKYINSQEDHGFYKNKELYGIHEARAAARAEGFIILVEGQMDRTGLKDAGVLNAVSPGGTSFTKDHAKAIHAMDVDVVIWFDFDRAGFKAALKTAEILLSVGRFSKIMYAPSNAKEDPDTIRQMENIDLKEFIAMNSYEIPDLMSEYFHKINAQRKIKVVNQMKEMASKCLMQFMADDIMDRFKAKTKITDSLPVQIVEPLPISRPKPFQSPVAKVLAHLYGNQADIPKAVEWLGEGYEFEDAGMNAIWHYLSRKQEIPKGLAHSEAAEALVNLEMDNDIYISPDSLRSLCRAMRVNWISRRKQQISTEVSIGNITPAKAVALLSQLK